MPFRYALINADNPTFVVANEQSGLPKNLVCHMPVDGGDDISIGSFDSSGLFEYKKQHDLDANNGTTQNTKGITALKPGGDYFYLDKDTSIIITRQTSQICSQG